MWKYRKTYVTQLDQMPEGVIGFVYIIINPDTLEWYVGKKFTQSLRTLPPLKGQTRKRKVVKESNWLTYQSSNDTVKAWVSPMKEILEYCYSKKELTFREIQAIICMQGLEDDKCLNDNILGKFFRKDLQKPTL